MPAPIMATMATSVTPARTPDQQPGPGRAPVHRPRRPRVPRRRVGPPSRSSRRAGAVGYGRFRGRLALPAGGEPRRDSDRAPYHHEGQHHRGHDIGDPTRRPAEPAPAAAAGAAARRPGGPGSSAPIAASVVAAACCRRGRRAALLRHLARQRPARPSPPSASRGPRPSRPATTCSSPRSPSSQRRINGFEWLAGRAVAGHRPGPRRAQIDGGQTARGEPAAQPAAHGRLPGRRGRRRPGAPGLRRGLRHGRNRRPTSSPAHRPTGSSTPATRSCGRRRAGRPGRGPRGRDRQLAPGDELDAGRRARGRSPPPGDGRAGEPSPTPPTSRSSASSGLTTRDVEPDFPFDVTIDPGQVRGPSAGLAFTLAVLDVLTPGDITNGVPVAVTGTIDGLGRVGPDRRRRPQGPRRRAGRGRALPGPAGEEDARSRVGDDMRIVPVATLQDALEALDELGGQRDGPRVAPYHRRGERPGFHATRPPARPEPPAQLPGARSRGGAEPADRRRREPAGRPRPGRTSCGPTIASLEAELATPGSDATAELEDAKRRGPADGHRGPDRPPADPGGPRSPPQGPAPPDRAAPGRPRARCSRPTRSWARPSRRRPPSWACPCSSATGCGRAGRPSPRPRRRRGHRGGPARHGGRDQRRPGRRPADPRPADRGRAPGRQRLGPPGRRGRRRGGGRRRRARRWSRSSPSWPPSRRCASWAGEPAGVAQPEARPRWSDAEERRGPQPDVPESREPSRPTRSPRDREPAAPSTVAEDALPLFDRLRRVSPSRAAPAPTRSRRT